jgi:hypothetical protein
MDPSVFSEVDLGDGCPSNYFDPGGDCRADRAQLVAIRPP